MKYSVIVPYYNPEPWLERCCESLHNLTGDFEFLLVNDNSTDGGPDIVARFAQDDARFNPLENERTKGVSGARNTGIDHAKGQWITFLDADDEMLESAPAAFEEATKTDMNIHQINHMRYYSAINKLTMKYYNHGDIYDVENLPKHWFGVWNKLFKAEFLSNIRFKEGLQYGEDGLFVLECLAKDGKIHHTNTSVVAVKHRFDNKQSLSHIKTSKDIIEQIHAYESFLFEQTNTELIKRVCDEIALLWSNRIKKALVTEK